MALPWRRCQLSADCFGPLLITARGSTYISPALLSRAAPVRVTRPTLDTRHRHRRYPLLPLRPRTSHGVSNFLPFAQLVDCMLLRILTLHLHGRGWALPTSPLTKVYPVHYHSNVSRRTRQPHDIIDARQRRILFLHYTLSGFSTVTWCPTSSD